VDNVGIAVSRIQDGEDDFFHSLAVMDRWVGDPVVTVLQDVLVESLYLFEKQTSKLEEEAVRANHGFDNDVLWICVC
jgi:hypothetical protein